MRRQAAVADPVGEEERRLARVHDHADVRAGVGEAEHRVAGGAASSRPRRGRRSGTASSRARRRRARRPAGGTPPAGLTSRRFASRAERVVRRRGRSGRRPRAARTARRSGPSARRRPPAISSARRSGSRMMRQLLGSGMSRSARHAGALSNGVRHAGPKRMPMPRAVVCGRRSAPSPFCCSTVSSASVWMPGTFFVWLRPNVAGRPVRRLISPSNATSGCVRRSPSASALAERGTRLRTRRADGRPSPARSRAARAGPRSVPGTSRPSGTRCSAVREVEKPSAPASIASATSSHIASTSASVAGVLVERALAHRVDPHRAVPDHAARVDALRHAVDRVEVLAVGLPVPVEALHDRVGRDVLDRLHHLGEVAAVARACTARTSRRSCRARPT